MIMNTRKNGQVRVLHLDDEPLILEITRLHLERTGTITVTSVESAEEALTRLNESRYDAVLSDYEMPDLDGIGFLKKIRDMGYDLPFILYTGKGREEVVIRAFNNGATFYLQKGGDVRSMFAELGQKVNQAAGQYRSRQKLHHLHRIFRGLRTVSGTLQGNEELDQRLRKVCGYCASHLGYNQVRIALFDQKGCVRVIYHSGLSGETDSLLPYLHAVQEASCTIRAREPVPEPVVCEPALTCRQCPLYRAQEGEYALTMRIEHGGMTYGIISATLSPVFAEDSDEQALFTELANEIAYAIHHSSLQEEQTAMETLMGTSRKLHIINSITRHDIRNQLTIQMNIYESLLDHGDMFPEMRSYLTALGSTIHSIQEHLIFSDVYQKIGVQRPRWLSISGIIEGITCSHHFGEISIIHSVGTVEVYTDVMFGKIVTNLIENAIMHGKRVTTIRIGFITQGLFGVITVEDDGIGVPEEMKKQIFERGFGGNTGLGLYYTREILGITGMEIHETGVPEEGARFEIRIPKNGYRMRKGEDAEYLSLSQVSEGV